jgi:hypothetical protein
VTVEADIKTVLADVCPRVFPDFAPTNTTKPYVTYIQIGGDAINALNNSTPNKQIGEFQVDIWGNSRASVAALMLDIEAAMRAATQFTAVPIGAPRSDFDADMKVYGTKQDFRVISTR